MKVTALILLTVATVALGSDHFTKRFAYTQVMSKCFGEKNYYDWIGTVITAAKECYHEPMKMWKKPDHSQENMVADLAKLLKGNRPVILPLFISQGEFDGNTPFQIPFNLFANRQKRETETPLYSAPLLKKLMMKAMAKVSNFTCVLKKIKVVDENLNIDTDYMKSQYENLTLNAVLNQDLVKGLDHCHQFSMCLPVDESPMPQEIKKLVTFMKCDKKMRMAICMKQDILNYLEIFDVSELPIETEDEAKIAEKLLHILWGSEAKEEFEIY